MRVKKPSKRNAWLITWESSRDDYLADLKRPRVVAILKPLLSPLKLLALLVDHQLRVTDYVDEQDVADFEFHF